MRILKRQHLGPVVLQKFKLIHLANQSSIAEVLLPLELYIIVTLTMLLLEFAQLAY